MLRPNPFRWVLVCLLLLQALLVCLFLAAPFLFFPVDFIRQGMYLDARHTNAIYDRNGKLLYQVAYPTGMLRYDVSLADVPQELIDAVIATEDASFYVNPGFDIAAILRAAWDNLRSGRVVSGASTITQQVVRLHLPLESRYEPSVKRKLQEIVLAYTLTRSFSKDEILEMYLNHAYFGQQAYGAAAAAIAYFAKPLNQLDLAECAFLAGLPQGPALYDPFNALERARNRQRTVLDLMVRHRKIERAAADLAANEPLQFSMHPSPFLAPHFSVMVTQALERILGSEELRSGGLRVFTTLDYHIQRISETQLRNQLRTLNTPAEGKPGHNAHNGAVVVIEPTSGAIRALVGSPDYESLSSAGAFNGATALRQPGSALKPITYAAAFARGMTAATMVADVPASFLTAEGQVYSPQNYDRVFHGPVLLRQALACSYNVAAVQVLAETGIAAFTSLARQMGITSLTNAARFGLALTLGGVEVSLLELTSAYSVFANGGFYVAPYLIERVEKADGQILYQAAAGFPQRVLDERVAFLITDILSDPSARAPAFGLNSALELPFPAAVKTGTTGEWRDNWTVGYTTQAVTGVWVGNADNQPMVDVSGVTGAAPIWNAVMRSVHSTAPPAAATPEGLERVEVCALSGLLPGEACSHTRFEWFMAEHVPVQTCGLHQWQNPDGQLVRLSSQTEFSDLRRIIVWPPELMEWARSRGLVARQQFGDAPQAALRFLSPAHRSVYRLDSSIPLDNQRIEIVILASQPFDAITLYIDGQLAVTWTEPPYHYFWPLQIGTHSLYTRGVHWDTGDESQSEIEITVERPAW